MASVGGAVLTQGAGLTFGAGFGVGLLGMAVLGGAAWIDSRFIMPQIAGDGGRARPRKLFDLQTGTLAPGSPRMWAVGRRIRVPLHVMLQSDKVRESSAGGAKGGVPGTIRRVFSDVGLVLNNRYTERIVQLAASGKLVYWTERNLQTVVTHGMTASDSSGDLLLTMGSTAEPDFNDKFEVDDIIKLSGWVANGGPDINAGYWKVAAVKRHDATPSTLTLDIYGGQTLAGLAATAGTSLAPAKVARVDDAMVEHNYASTTYGTSPLFGVSALNIIATTSQFERFVRVFSIGDKVTLSGWTAPAGANGAEWQVIAAQAGGSGGTITLKDILGGHSGSYTSGSSSNAGVIRPFGTSVFPSGMFDAEPTFYQGTESQTEDAIIARHHETLTIPHFRGLSYLMLDQFDLATDFGNMLPIMEAIIEPNPASTFGDALVAICERSGFRPDEVDVSGVSARPFEGYYIRGAQPGVTALQPVLLAGQIATQERDTVIAFFDLDAADVVQIENGELFSDLGARGGADTPNQADKIMFGEFEDADLPSSLTVKHQDSDNVYADGSQHFGIRNPSGVRHINESELDLSTMVLSRKQAANLATTVMRRTWINAQTVELSLPVAYIEVLENDLLTVTTDDGEEVTARVIRRELGQNFLINIIAVREQLDLAVGGSPVQESPLPQRVITQAPLPVVSVLDIPPLNDADRHEPGYYAAACAPAGGTWSGVSVYESLDGGTTYALAGQLSAQAGIGVLTDDLDAGDPAEPDLDGTITQDGVSSLEVQFDNVGQLVPITSDEATVAAGFNWFHIEGTDGDFEIVGAITVTDDGDGHYTMTDLLRGLRGTATSAAVTKTAGAKVTALTAFPGFLRRIPTSDWPATVHLKFVPAGRSLAEVDAIEVEVNGWNARPMPVMLSDLAVDGSNNIAITLRHWSRINHPVGYAGPWALDETHEGYRVRIYDDATGLTLEGVLMIDATGTGSSTLATPTFIYTATEQTADGLTPGGTHWYEFEQLGDWGINTDSGTPERAGGRTFRQQL